MKQLLIIIAIFCACLTESQVLQEFSSGYDKFSFGIYQELLKRNSGNFMVCPLSVDTVLDLVNTGAQGQAAKELTTTLHLPDSPEKVYEIFKTLSPNLQRNDSTAVNVFDAEIQSIDFSENEAAAADINRWVEYKTHNKIKNLIDPRLLDKDTRTDKPSDVSMHIVLPHEIEGLGAVENKLDEVLIPPTYNYETVDVWLPKFKIESGINFKPALRALGVKSAFEDYANFRGIGANQEDLKITEVIQKAFIEVDETGTIVAAATAVNQVETISTIFDSEPPKLFHCDHPFLFYLRLNKLGISFFVGRYTSPSS